MSEPGENATTAIAPLKTITPIEVAPVSDHVIAPAEIAVRPLTAMTDVVVAPLTPLERRN